MRGVLGFPLTLIYQRNPTLSGSVAVVSSVGNHPPSYPPLMHNIPLALHERSSATFPTTFHKLLPRKQAIYGKTRFVKIKKVKKAYGLRQHFYVNSGYNALLNYVTIFTTRAKTPYFVKINEGRKERTHGYGSRMPKRGLFQTSYRSLHCLH